MAEGMTERRVEAATKIAAQWEIFASTNGFLPYRGEEMCDVENRLRNQIDWLRQKLIDRELAGTKVEGLRRAEEIATKVSGNWRVGSESEGSEILNAIRAEREKVEGEYGDNSCS